MRVFSYQIAGCMGKYSFKLPKPLISIHHLWYKIKLARSTFKKLKGVHELYESVIDQQSMLLLFKKELSSYSIFDFMKVQAFFEKDCKDLPPVYKDKFKKKMLGHLFDNFKSILSSDNSPNESFDMEQYQEFLERFGSKLNDAHEVPQIVVLYYFSAMYNIFITNTPPHPEGTPFPGGFFVERMDEDYFCPVKDKQKYNDEAICKFCVAKQMEMK
ncbi:MAG: DUF2115 family protein [Methanosarcinaceae archaeon]|nr:DUF2115 family protein [Methanosarcinaceae archaeon]